jgi:Rieske Fe-S protein
MPESHSLSRRQSLAQIVKFLVLVAMLAFSWVIFSSFTTSGQDKVNTAAYYVDVELSGLEAGQLRKVSLRHRQVWIYHRTDSDIQRLKKSAKSLRSEQDKYFVFFPYEPQRNCLLSWDETNRAFYDPCFARHFDLAGRRLNDKQAGLPMLLAIPQYRFISPRQLQIDARSANFR